MSHICARPLARHWREGIVRRVGCLFSELGVVFGGDVERRIVDKQAT